MASMDMIGGTRLTLRLARVEALMAFGVAFALSGCNTGNETVEGSTTKVVRQLAVTADSVVVRALASGYQIEVRSRAGFPPGAYDPVLHVGTRAFQRVRYLPISDCQGISYAISAAEFAELENGAPIRVAYPNSPEHAFGVLDKNAVVPQGAP